jgi:Zn-dependent M28 family amino/carboxypeptidase
MIRLPRTCLAALGAGLLSASCSTPVSTAPYPEIDSQQIRTHLDKYAEAEKSGMEPGGRGEQIAVAYTKSVFTAMGLDVKTPTVPLTRIRPTHTTMALAGASGTRTMQEGPDFVAWTRRHEIETAAAGDLVFVGYGISAPRQGWDDYKDANVRGKILLMLLGDPHVGDRHLLGEVGGDLFGRSRYKFEEAERRGAVGVMLIHVDERAEETWEQIEESSTEVIDSGSPGQPTVHMPFEGWLNFEAARRLFKDSGRDLDEEVTKAQETNFTPLPLPIRAAVQIQSDIGALSTTNVVATIPAFQQPSEYVLYSTQWNNLPVGQSTGADLSDADPTNQSPPGVSVLLEVARALSQVKTPHRAFTFLVVTAESQGVLGLENYLDNPAFSAAATRAAIHVVGFNVHGADKRVAVVGVSYEALKGLVRERAADQFRVAEADFDPERTHYFRPAKIAYTLKQIPSVFLSSGGSLESANVPGPPDMSVGVLDARLLFQVGLHVATDGYWPAWTPSRSLLDYVPKAPAIRDLRPPQRGIR